MASFRERRNPRSRRETRGFGLRRRSCGLDLQSLRKDCHSGPSSKYGYCAGDFHGTALDPGHRRDPHGSLEEDAGAGRALEEKGLSQEKETQADQENSTISIG